MEALILAGGYGKRLRKLISSVPKVMAPIGDKPFLEIVLNNLSNKGIKHFILSVGYKHEIIKEYFGNGFNNIPISYVIERKPLGTGGAVKNCLNKISGEKFFVLNGDTYTNIKIKKLKKFIDDNKIRSLLVGKEINDINRYGALEIKNGLVSNIYEKKLNGKGIISVGFYLLEKEIFKKYSTEETFSLENDFLPLLIQKEKVSFFQTDGDFIDIGIPKDYIYANKILTEK